jgi:hypothetical protein
MPQACHWQQPWLYFNCTACMVLDVYTPLHACLVQGYRAACYLCALSQICNPKYMLRFHPTLMHQAFLAARTQPCKPWHLAMLQPNIDARSSSCQPNPAFQGIVLCFHPTLMHQAILANPRITHREAYAGMALASAVGRGGAAAPVLDDTQPRNAIYWLWWEQMKQQTCNKSRNYGQGNSN